MHARLSTTARKLRAIFERLPDISSPGMLSTTENVCLGDASIGVARNPLRDGAPPTGQSADASDVSSVRPSQKSTKPLAALHRASGQRRSTWVTACAALFSGGLRRGAMRSQAPAFVKTMQSTHQRRLDQKRWSLLVQFPRRP